MKEINLYKFLFEDNDVDDKNAIEGDVSVNADAPKARHSKDSVDDQIDGLILKYENSSIKEKAEDIMESITNKNLKYLLFEQEEDVEEPEEAADTETDTDTDTAPTDPTGSEDSTVTAAAGKQQVPNLNIDQFTKRCVRLIINYRNLLKIEEAIVNRIKNFLDEHYGDAYVSNFLQVLQDEHGISVQEFNDDSLNSADTDVPFAVGANASGTGAGG
jgi:hypothetical protein